MNRKPRGELRTAPHRGVGACGMHFRCVALRREGEPMSTFIMLTKMSREDSGEPEKLKQLERRAVDQIRQTLPQVKWKASYVRLNDSDYLDIFEAPDMETAAKTAAIIRSVGHGQAQVWPAMEWDEFKRVLDDLPAGAA